MSDERQFSAHEMETNERLTRVEGKIDLILEHQNAEKEQGKILAINIQEHHDRLGKLETEKHVWSKVIHPLVTIGAGLLGGWWGKH